jgi:hypothetical protein
LESGGFDVVIGNPPYVAVNKIDYSISEHSCYKFPDIYGYVLLRSIAVGNKNARYGMIVPLSLTFSGDFSKLRAALVQNMTAWFSSFDNIPASLFAGVSQRCTIWLGYHSPMKEIYVTPMCRWRAEARDTLFQKIRYAKINDFQIANSGIPKIANQTQEEILKAIERASHGKGTIFASSKTAKHKLGFSKAARNFISIFIEEPPCLDEQTLKRGITSEIGYIALKNPETVKAALASLLSEFYFWYWLTFGDGFHVTSKIISNFLHCLKGIDENKIQLLASLGELLHQRRYHVLVFKKNAGKFVGNYNYRLHYDLTRRADLLLIAGLGLQKKHAKEIFGYVQGVLSINVFAGEKGIPETVKNKFPPIKIDEGEQKKIINEIDRVLAAHYGFTEEELNFIINYDIKYRMGRGEAEEEE